MRTFCSSCWQKRGTTCRALVLSGAEGLELMGLTLEQAKELFRKSGQVYAIYQKDTLAGYYWIEERGKVLHLHGLALKSEFQGRGIGTQVLGMLSDQYAGRREAIELGVHESNEGAKRLYEKLGYRTVKHLQEPGFYIMQLPLVEQPLDTKAG